MFKKELADVVKQTLWFFAVVAVLPAVLVLLKVAPAPYAAVFMPFFQGGIMFWSLFLGATLFGRERGQRAAEYALSLPFSRAGLFGRLIAARAAVLAGVWVVSWIAYAAWGSPFSALYPLGLAIHSLPLFIISASLAPLVENFIALCLISLVAWLASSPAGVFLVGLILRAKGYPFPWPTARIFYPRIMEALPSLIMPAVSILSFCLTVIPFGAALIFAIHKFDIRPSRAFIARYLKAFAVGLGLCLAVGVGLAYVLISGREYGQVSMTSEETVLELRPYRVKIHTPEGVTRLKTDRFVYQGFESAGGFFLADGSHNLIRLNLETGATEEVHRRLPGETGPRYLATYGGKIVFVAAARKGASLSLVEIDGRTGERAIIGIRGREENGVRGPALIFGTGIHDGRRYWLAHIMGREKRPFRIWDDGTTEDLFPRDEARIQSLYAFGDLVLRFDEEGTKVYRDRDGRLDPMKAIGDSVSFAYWDYFNRDLDPGPIRAVFGKHGLNIARLDLETLEITEVAALETARGAQVIAYFPDRFYLLETGREDGTTRISLVNKEGLTPLREFKNFDPAKPGYHLDFQKGGVVLTRRNKIEVYAFPGLEELRYKSL
jgi:hypothetical protein